MIKQIKDLQAGDVFKDDFGNEITTQKIVPVEWLGTEETKEKVTVYFKTKYGFELYQNYKSNRKVFVQKH